MKIKIENHDDGTTRVIDYPGTVRQFIAVHFVAFGFYRVEKTGAAYLVYNKFDGAHNYTVKGARA